MSQRDNEMLALARRAGQECKALGLRIDALEAEGDAVELSGISTTGFTDGRMVRIASGGGIEERTTAQVLSDIGAAASGHTHAQLHDAATVSGNGIQISGQQISLSIGTGSNQVAAGNHSHSGVYQPVLSAYSTIAALSGYPSAFPTTAAQVADSTSAGRALLTAADESAQQKLLNQWIAGGRSTVALTSTVLADVSYMSIADTLPIGSYLVDINFTGLVDPTGLIKWALASSGTISTDTTNRTTWMFATTAVHVASWTNGATAPSGGATMANRISGMVHLTAPGNLRFQIARSAAGGGSCNINEGVLLVRKI